MATLAPCLVTLRSEFDKLNPNRDKASDGWIGDESHQSGNSDHNPVNGVVHAIDVDESGPWPSGGTMEKFCQHLVTECRKSGESGQDRGRLKYIIYERRIWEASNGWNAREYTGANAHDKHMHVSCEYNASYANDTAPWGIVEKWGSDVTESEFKSWMTEWANSGDGKKAIANAVLTWDPGNNETGATNGGVKNPDYGVAGNTNATVGSNYALERALHAAKVGYEIRDHKLPEILAAIQQINAVDVDELASAIVAQLPPDGLTKQQVKEALSEVLTYGTAGVPVAPPA